jgi:hypothetical protein
MRGQINVVAETIVQAARDHTPRLRYPSGKAARQAAFARRFAPRSPIRQDTAVAIRGWRYRQVVVRKEGAVPPRPNVPPILGYRSEPDNGVNNDRFCQLPRMGYGLHRCAESLDQCRGTTFAYRDLGPKY